MATYTGMDAVEIRQLARAMRQAAADIKTAAAVTTNEVTSADWKGPDRERFLGTWQGHARAIQAAAEALAQAATEAVRSAEAQERASAR